MKRYSAIAMLLLVAGAMVAACSTPDLELPSDVGESVSGQMKFTAALAAKTPVTKSVNEDGKTAWEEGEKIAVFYMDYEEGYVKAEAVVQHVDENGKATISATLVNAQGNTPVYFVYPYGLMDESGNDGTAGADDFDVMKLLNITDLLTKQHGTITDISTNFDAATGKGTLVTDGTSCSTDKAVKMTNQVLIGKFIPKYNGSPIGNITTLIIRDSTNTYTVTPAVGTAFGDTIYVAMLPVANKEVTFLATKTASEKYGFGGKRVTLDKGTLYNNLSIPMLKAHDLKNDGSFSGGYDAFIYQTKIGIDTTTTNTITIAAGNKVILSGVNIKAVGENDADLDVNAINCLGDATIVLSGTNTVKNKSRTKATIKAGPYTTPSNTKLTFCGEGVLTVSSLYTNSKTKDEGALIGSDQNGKCGDIDITGGTINAIGKADQQSAAIGAGRADSESRCGIIKINGGTVSAKGGVGAGIGSGVSYNGGNSFCDGIIITGVGIVDASAVVGAAIGSGNVNGSSGTSECTSILISGSSDVTATTSSSGNTSGSGAAIGSGSKGTVVSIIIEGGTVRATCNNLSTNNSGAGIGSGLRGSCTSIMISGGSVRATGGKLAAGIGSGYRGTCGDNDGNDIVISGGSITATGGESAAGIGSGSGYGSYNTSCGNIAIGSSVTSVTATKGADSQHSIGLGKEKCSCGTVTIGCTFDGAGEPVGGTTGYISDSPYTYTPAS